MLLLFGVAPLCSSACGDDQSPAARQRAEDGGAVVDASSDVVGEAALDAGAPSCGSASGSFPSGLTELAWDDGAASSSLREETLSVTVNGVTFALAEEPLYEVVRFELEHPARIHGFRVQWRGVPAGAGDLELTAGLFRDFGYNGFDFWADDPLWTGTRCAADVTEGEWVDYVFEAPIEIEEPGLVYAGHRAELGAASLAFDATAAESCEAFDSCRSAINLPEAPFNYNGISLPFQNDFLVRLLVEYTDDVQPADRVFAEVAGPSGSHISWGDFDADGWDDAWVAGKLFRNDGGVFSDVTAAAGLDVSGYGYTGGVWGDYDNDGCLDLFAFTESKQNSDSLFRSNCDGTFADVTSAAQIVDMQSYEDCGDPANVASPTAAAAWADFDADGLLDLYTANYECGSKNTHYRDVVYCNAGDGTFSECGPALGFSSDRTPSRGVAPIDHDGDGDVDLFVNNYRLVGNVFFANAGDGTFSERAMDLGLVGRLTVQGFAAYFGHTIGAAWGDLDNDGDFDLVAANLAHPRFYDFSNKSQILLNDGSGAYVDATGPWDKPFDNPTGLRYQETHSVPVLADFDLDGSLDLAVTCVYDGRPTDFYWGRGDGTFELDSYRSGITTENGWGAAASDFDNDGDVDLFATQLFENQGPPQGHWLQVRAVGNVAANRAAIGSTVKVSAGAKSWIRHVQGGSGKGGQDSMVLTFGLGDATAIDQIEVTFPGGKTVTFSGPLGVDRRVWVLEDGSLHEGTAPP